MRPSLARVTSLVGLSLLAAAPALAQRRDEYVECYRDGRRVSCESVRDDRQRALERARDARERAQEQVRAARERTLERAREARERAAETRRRELERQRDRQREYQRDQQRATERRRAVERTERRRRWYDDTRTTFGLGGGADVRRFGEVNRYVTGAGVDFHSRSGIGVRPEVTFGWTDRRTEYLSTVCVTCSVLPQPTIGPLAVSSRSQMLGVGVNGTYTFLRRTMVRPYVLGGVGVVTTRETFPVLATPPTSSTPLAYRTETHDHTDFGLNAGTGLEFGRGPVRVFTELRYFLSDSPSPRGFSGMLPITAGVRF